MINTKRGALSVEGTLGEIHSDLAVIVHGLNYSILPEDMTAEEAKES